MYNDEGGYVFTPMTVLLFIPIVIIAIAYADIVNEANMLAALATGGDVTITVVSSLYSDLRRLLVMLVVTRLIMPRGWLSIMQRPWILTHSLNLVKARSTLEIVLLTPLMSI